MTQPFKRTRYERQTVKGRKGWSELRVERRVIPERETRPFPTVPTGQTEPSERPALRSIAAEVAHLVRNAPLRFPKVLF
jgi:hypothetical protein